MNRESFYPFKSVEKVIGIEVGLSKFLTDSKGNTIENPRFLKIATRNLRIKQKNLYRKGSKNRAKARAQVAKAREKSSHARNDFQHKVSKILADENQAFGIEDLNIERMKKIENLQNPYFRGRWERHA